MLKLNLLLFRMGFRSYHLKMMNASVAGPLGLTYLLSQLISLGSFLFLMILSCYKTVLFSSKVPFGNFQFQFI